MSGDERDEQVAKELADLRVEQLLVNTTTMLASLAALRLGEEERDLEQAKLAIDAMKALQRPLQDFLGDDLKSQLNALLASLQMAYVNAVVPATVEDPNGQEAGGGDAA